MCETAKTQKLPTNEHKAKLKQIISGFDCDSAPATNLEDDAVSEEAHGGGRTETQTQTFVILLNKSKGCRPACDQDDGTL